jgi:hypothetical protein
MLFHTMAICVGKVQPFLKVHYRATETPLDLCDHAPTLMENAGAFPLVVIRELRSEGVVGRHLDCVMLSV